MKSVFIVWYSHSRRAETLADELGGRIYFVYESRLRGRWLLPLRYLVQGWKTWRLLEREQPDVALVQSPPILAPLVVALWCGLRGKRRHAGRRLRFAIDCHTGTFYSREWRWALPLLRWLARRAAVTLVASEAALDILQQWQVRSMFLMDGLPVLQPASGVIGTEGGARVALISSFHDDEPVAEVFAAARLLPHVTFYLSGNPRNVPAGLLAQQPSNVVLTGFLPDSMYTGLLKNVDGLIVLTTEPNVLNCGAYEAVSIGKPALVSDWPQMRRYFTRGFIYVKNTPESIVDGVRNLLDEQETLTAEIIAMRTELVSQRQPKLQEFVALLH
jgi:Glycosyltransferase Family 4